MDAVVGSVSAERPQKRSATHDRLGVGTMDAVVGWVSAERPQKRSATHGRGKTRVRFYGAALM